MPRFAARISADDLRKKIDSVDIRSGEGGEKLEKDLSKVRFDRENFEPDDKVEIEDVTNAKGGIYLVGDLTFALFYAGGDWEFPITFAVYWDGKDLRGYIPRNGNIWNEDTKRALGSDEEADTKFVKKNWKRIFDRKPTEEEIEEIVGDCCGDIITPNYPKMFEEIAKRIVVKE